VELVEPPWITAHESPAPLELGSPTSQDLPDDRPTKPQLETGAPRSCVEVLLVAISFVTFGLSLVPWELKKGRLWYKIAHASILFSTMVCVAGLYVANTHNVILRFLSSKKVFVLVVGLSLCDCMRLMMFPEPGWEVTERLQAASYMCFRLGFVCSDSLRGMSFWFRKCTSLIFMFGNAWLILQAYFLNEAQIIFVISATNTTITTSSVQASIGTTMVTLTMQMLVTIFADPGFQYSALYRSHLPKIAVDPEETDQIIEERVAAILAWKEWPKKTAILILTSIANFVLSMVVSAFPSLAMDASGKESWMLIMLRSSAATLGGAGSCGFFHNNINKGRFEFAFTSVRGLLWIFYTVVFAVAGFAQPDPDTPVSSVLSTLYTTLGLLAWLAFDCVKQISRLMHTTVTIFINLTIVAAIYFSLYVWKNDAVLADLNSVQVPGVLTRYSLQRTCLVNLGFLMAGSLATIMKRNLSANQYFALVDGNVRRKDIIDLEPGFDLAGHVMPVQ
jgi:hypothetical protein